MWSSGDHHNYWCFALVLIHLASGIRADCMDSNDTNGHGNITRDCFNGHCVANVCKCNQGWTGLHCDECGGRVLLDSDTGFITDGMKDYAKARECSWIIQPKARNATIRLRLLEFATECGWDYLYIYDGDSALAPILATFNGLLPQDIEDEPTLKRYHTEVAAKSGTAFIHFFSDAGYVMKGFNMSYVVDLCPQDCSGHGTCISVNMDVRCNCDAGWFGEACEIESCLENCSSAQNLVYCGNFSSLEDGDGICYSGNCGNSSLSSGEAFWCEHITAKGVLNVARSSHSGVIFNGSIWLYGGIQFGELSSYTGGFDVYNLLSGEWRNVQPITSTFPSWRYGHSSVMYDNKIIVFGGREVFNSQAMDQVWEFNLLTKSWMEILYSDSFPTTFSNKTVSPLALWGHSGTLVEFSDGRAVMLIMFGFHTEYEYSGFVYEYDIRSNTWSQAITTGAKVEASFGHSTTWDPINRLCYIHGGIVYLEHQKYGMTDSLLSYDPERRKFQALRSSGIPRYLHSGLLVDGVLLIYGGCTHNDSNKSTGALCFSPSFQAYYIACDIWDSLPSLSNMFNPDRYGHLALNLNGQPGRSPIMVIHGGYDGRMLDDVLFYQTASCSLYSDEITCAEIHHEGLACMWNGVGCVASQEIFAYQSQNVSCEHKAGALTSFCPSMKECASCVNSAGNCAWCNGDCSSKCTNDEEGCPEDDVQVYCERFRSCGQCELNENCQWSESYCIKRSDNKTAECRVSCGMQTSCNTCVDQNCMWCSNKMLCVSTSSYVVQFPYGECMKWVNDKPHCEAAEGCGSYRTCESCLTDPFCGWCDNGSQTGLGTCRSGSFSTAQPLILPRNVLSYSRLYYNSSSSCEAEKWFFTDCPLCQCNGHSRCFAGTSECISCGDNTAGDQCEKCVDGYFGQATNGGTCIPCQCFDRADVCNHTNGACFCSTKGAIGGECDKCDNSIKYYGDPANNGTCFYRLLINYSFNFSLTQRDRYVTAINFENTLIGGSGIELNFESGESCDVRFTVHSSSGMTAESHDGFNSSLRDFQYEEEVEILYARGVKKFSHDFSGSHYGFGDPSSNTTIRIYVNNFTIPVWIQVSLVQRNNYILMLLLILFSCFLILLLVTALVWKLKLLYDTCRQRRQREEQLEQMAARPFATVFLRFDDDEVFSQSGYVIRQKKEADIVSEEAFATGKASAVSAVLRMPATANEKIFPSKGGVLSVGTTLLASANSPLSSNDESAHCKTRLSRSKKLNIIFRRGRDLRSRGRAAISSGPENALNLRRIDSVNTRAQPNSSASRHHCTESSVSVRSRRQRSKRGRSTFSSLRSRSVSPSNDIEGNSTAVQTCQSDSRTSNSCRQLVLRPADSRSEGVAV